MNTAKKMIRNAQAATRAMVYMTDRRISYRTIEQEQKEKENAQVRLNAEKVYQSYIHQGEAIAKERKDLYLQRNLK